VTSFFRAQGLHGLIAGAAIELPGKVAVPPQPDPEKLLRPDSADSEI